MNRLQNFCAATCLTLIFALSGFAGEIGCPYVPPPPPPPDQPQVAAAGGSYDTLMQSVLVVLQNVLSLG
jgi:hypothetical protein